MLSSRALKEGLGIKVAKNSKYMPEGIVKFLIYISLNKTSAESSSKELAKICKNYAPDAITA